MSTEATGRADAVLWITRMMTDGNDHEVASIGYAGTGALDTFNHARRVLGPAADEDDLEPGDLIVTVLGSGGDGAEDDPDPLRVPAGQADWFLNEWLKVPRAWRSDLRKPRRRTGPEDRLLQ